ncbi:MAG TPA: hypothetical protein VIK64_16120 [Anaerolineales bacterium]|jgi:hypothetical protein
MSPIEFAVSIFAGLHIGLTFVAIGIAALAAAFIVYRLVRTRD